MFITQTQSITNFNISKNYSTNILRLCLCKTFYFYNTNILFVYERLFLFTYEFNNENYLFISNYVLIIFNKFSYISFEINYFLLSNNNYFYKTFKKRYNLFSV